MQFGYPIIRERNSYFGYTCAIPPDMWDMQPLWQWQRCSLFDGWWISRFISFHKLWQLSHAWESMPKPIKSLRMWYDAGSQFGSENCLNYQKHDIEYAAREIRRQKRIAKVTLNRINMYKRNLIYDRTNNEFYDFPFFFFHIRGRMTKIFFLQLRHFLGWVFYCSILYDKATTHTKKHVFLP